MRFNKKAFLTTTLSLLCAGSVFAEGNRTDYDLDDDGLIEINDLQDLDEIRNNFSGVHLYGSDQGCPTNGCHGYELTTDLDFDTNQDGVMDENDTYWNNGRGWEPLFFSNKTFEGNNFEIKNLYINVSNANHQGLFGNASNSHFRNLGLTGPLMLIDGHTRNGALVANLEGGTVDNVYSTGDVIAWEYTGGLIGRAIDVVISNSYSTGNVIGQINDVGGLIGLFRRGQVINCHATGNVSEPSEGYIQPVSGIGGLIGSTTDGSVTQSYATGNVTAIDDNTASNRIGGFIGNVSGTEIIANFSTGDVTGNSYVGGFIGRIYGSSEQLVTIKDNFALGNVTQVLPSSREYTGGFAGLVNSANISNNYIINSVTAPNTNAQNFIGNIWGTTGSNNYWASDVANSALSATDGISSSFLVSELQCPTSASNTSCASATLFDGWDSSVNSDGEPLWHFGTSSELPGLRFNGFIYRDGNGVVAPPANLSIVNGGLPVGSANIIHEGNKGTIDFVTNPTWGTTHIWIHDWNTTPGDYTSLAILTNGDNRDSEGVDLSEYNEMTFTYRCHRWATIEAFFGSDKDSSQNFLGDLDCDENWNERTVNIAGMNKSDITTALWMYAPASRNSASDIVWGFFFMQIREVTLNR